MFNVCKVELELVVRGGIVLTVYLCVTRKAGFNLHSESKLGHFFKILRDNLGALGSRADKGHVAF